MLATVRVKRYCLYSSSHSIIAATIDQVFGISPIEYSLIFTLLSLPDISEHPRIFGDEHLTQYASVVFIAELRFYSFTLAYTVSLESMRKALLISQTIFNEATLIASSSHNLPVRSHKY